VSLRGAVISGWKPHHIARAGLGFVPEDRQIFPEHSVEDNLVIGRKRGPDGQDEWPIKRIYDVFPLLEPLRHRIAGRLSGGEQQMLAIARTLMGNPALLLLDEPSEGLAPIIVQRIGELLRQLRQLGSTVLIAEQNMHFCLGLASHATVIDKGQIVYAAGIDELKANDAIRRRYLALSPGAGASNPAKRRKLLPRRRPAEGVSPSRDKNANRFHCRLGPKRRHSIQNLMDRRKLWNALVSNPSASRWHPQRTPSRSRAPQSCCCGPAQRCSGPWSPASCWRGRPSLSRAFMTASAAWPRSPKA
jgi:branched-chain amino acid transport system ATP-binding protein